jgi:hypothetical protein
VHVGIGIGIGTGCYSGILADIVGRDDEAAARLGSGMRKSRPAPPIQSPGPPDEPEETC